MSVNRRDEKGATLDAILIFVGLVTVAATIWIRGKEVVEAIVNQTTSLVDLIEAQNDNL